MLQDAEVEELAKPRGTRTGDGGTGRGRRSRAASGGSGPTNAVGAVFETDQVDLIGSEVRRRDAQSLQPGLDGVHGLVEVHGDVDVAQGLDVSLGRPAEQIREDHPGTRSERPAERVDARFDPTRQRGLSNHGSALYSLGSAGPEGPPAGGYS